VSRADIVKITGLSPSSVTFIVNRLIRDGLIALERRELQVGAGRPPIALRLRPESMYAIGAEISLGGMRVVSADVSGQFLAEKHVEWHANPAVALARVRSAMLSMTRKFSSRRLVGIGVGIPGTIARDTEEVIAAENLGWFDLDAVRILSEGLPVRPALENDAKLAALAERWFHAEESAPPRNFVFVTASSGLGTGVFIDGHLMQGASGEGSEFGHIVIYPDGRPCVCGGRGCWEEYASGRALERLYSECKGAVQGLTAEDIVRRARAGDPCALERLLETARHVGLGLANLRQAFDPEEIVLGNYLAESWDLISETVWAVLRDRIAPRYLERVRIVPARHTENSALLGAIALALSKFFAPSEGVRSVQRAKRAARGRH
jgi:predicted NBD/HSP70 family sugar kinase